MSRPEEPTTEAARRRRRAEVFGETLPEQTSDDVEQDKPEDPADDEWLRRQVPPHHGG